MPTCRLAKNYSWLSFPQDPLCLVQLVQLNKPKTTVGYHSNRILSAHMWCPRFIFIYQIYVWIHIICIYICIYTYVYTRCIYAYIHITHTHTHTHTHLCTHRREQTLNEHFEGKATTEVIPVVHHVQDLVQLLEFSQFSYLMSILRARPLLR